MTDISIEKTNKSDFRSTIPESSNEELISILKKRSQYEKEAAELAVQEALKRRLIHSEQDLFSVEFMEPKNKKTIIPQIEDENLRNKTRKSIARILLITGSVPTVWGVLKAFEGKFVEGILLFLIGLIWVFSSFKIMRKFQITIINLFFILLAISTVYIVKLLLEMKGLVWMDYLIPVMFYSLIVYGLLFLRRLK